MGCGTSSAGATSAGDKDSPDSNFDETKTRKNEDAGGDEDFFDVVQAEGESFMASKPWKGQVIEPDNHLPLNPEKPDVHFELDYVYGYRTYGSRNNAFFNTEGKVCYFAAAVGVILDHQSNTQIHFGGGEVDTEAKNNKNDMDCHNDDIDSLGISADRSLCVTGQRGPNAAIFVWDSCTGQKICRAKAQGSKAIVACAISNDNKFIAAVDQSNDHNLHVFDAATGAQQYKQKGDQNSIYGVAFSNEPGSYTICTTGKRHIYFWDHMKNDKKKGLSGDHPLGTHMCAASDNDGCFYTGYQDGKLFKWVGRDANTVIQAHKGMVESIKWEGGQLYTGGRDGMICTFSTPDLTPGQSFNFGGGGVRAVDCHMDMMLGGVKEGTLSIQHKTSGEAKRDIMHSHNEGEVWGLAQCGDGKILTCGDDNKVQCWDPESRTRHCVECVTDEKKEVRRGASSQSSKPASQQARAVCEFNGCIVVACNDGAVRVKKAGTEGDVAVMRDSKEWIEVLTPSPDGTKLAVGSHDNNIYVYDNTFNLCYTCKGHTSYITAVDWDDQSTTMRSNSGDYELLFWDNTGKQDPSGRSNYKNTNWGSHTAKMAWTVEGIYPKGADGTYVNGVCASNDGNYILTGDDSRLWRIFNNPVRFNHKPRCYRGHSEFVCSVIWDKQERGFVWTVGGQDNTMMQWKRTA